MRLVLMTTASTVKHTRKHSQGMANWWNKSNPKTTVWIITTAAACSPSPHLSAERFQTAIMVTEHWGGWQADPQDLVAYLATQWETVSKLRWPVLENSTNPHGIFMMGVFQSSRWGPRRQAVNTEHFPFSPWLLTGQKYSSTPYHHQNRNTL